MALALDVIKRRNYFDAISTRLWASTCHSTYGLCSICMHIHIYGYNMQIELANELFWPFNCHYCPLCALWLAVLVKLLFIACWERPHDDDDDDDDAAAGVDSAAAVGARVNYGPLDCTRGVYYHISGAASTTTRTRAKRHTTWLKLEICWPALCAWLCVYGHEIS